MKKKLVVVVGVLLVLTLSASVVLAQGPSQPGGLQQGAQHQETQQQNGERLARQEMIRQLGPQCTQLKDQRGEILQLRAEIARLTQQVRERIKTGIHKGQPLDLPKEEIRQCLQNMRQQQHRLRDTLGQVEAARRQIRAGLRAGNCDRVPGCLEDIGEVQRERIARLQQIRDHLKEILALLDNSTRDGS